MKSLIVFVMYCLSAYHEFRNNVYIYIYIYVEIERERERDICICICICICMCICISMCIYIYIIFDEASELSGPDSAVGYSIIYIYIYYKCIYHDHMYMHYYY